MDFYLNENHLIVNKENIVDNLKEIKQFYDLLKAKNYKLCIKENLDLDYKELGFNNSIKIALSFLQHLESISTTEVNMLECNDIEPEVRENYYFIELISLCYRDSNELILSLNNENEILHPEYIVKNDNKFNVIKNIVGKDALSDFLIFNPVPQSINEVFEKAEKEFPHIKFTKKAYDTANQRAHIYKQFGFNRLLNIFKIIETLIYFFLKGDLPGHNQKTIEEEFKRQTNGVEFSHESYSTMQKYGYQREVTINGKKTTMTYHIKPSDNRIYFIYNETDDCIYIGHSGRHLDIASEN